jgi:hypothetical protein
MKKSQLYRLASFAAIVAVIIEAIGAGEKW